MIKGTQFLKKENGMDALAEFIVSALPRGPHRNAAKAEVSRELRSAPLIAKYLEALRQRLPELIPPTTEPVVLPTFNLPTRPPEHLPWDIAKFAVILRVPPAVFWTLICISCGLSGGIRLPGFKG